MFRNLLLRKTRNVKTGEARNDLEFYVKKWDSEDHERKEFVKIVERDDLGKFRESDVGNVRIGYPVLLQLPDGCYVQTSKVDKVEAENGKIIIHTMSREYYC